MHTLPDIAGDDAQHGLGAVAGSKAAWVQIIVTGAGTVRLGDASTSATRGLPIAAGGGAMAFRIAGAWKCMQ